MYEIISVLTLLILIGAVLALKNPQKYSIVKDKSRKAVFIYYGVAFIVVIILSTFFAPSSLESAEDHIDKDDFATAISYIEKINQSDEDYSKGQELLIIAKKGLYLQFTNKYKEAKKLVGGQNNPTKETFGKEDWNNIITLLNKFPEDHDNYNDVVVLYNNAKIEIEKIEKLEKEEAEKAKIIDKIL